MEKIDQQIKCMEYTNILGAAMIKSMKDDMDLEELIENPELTEAFLHALLNTMPTMIYNVLIVEGEGTDVLTVNHLANSLCFDFMIQEGDELDMIQKALKEEENKKE